MQKLPARSRSSGTSLFRLSPHKHARSTTTTDLLAAAIAAAAGVRPKAVVATAGGHHQVAAVAAAVAAPAAITHGDETLFVQLILTHIASSYNHVASTAPATHSICTTRTHALPFHSNI